MTATTAPAAPAAREETGGLGLVDLGRIAGRGLASRRVRSGLTALGIAIGIAAMLAVLGIAESSRATLLAQLDRIGSNLLVVTPGQSFFGDDVSLPDDAVAMIGRVGPVEGTAAVAQVSATVRRTDKIDADETGGIAVQAADPDLLDTLKGTVAHGHFIDDAVGRYPAVVLGSVAAERLGITDIDDPVTVWIGVTASIRTNTRNVDVPSTSAIDVDRFAAASGWCVAAATSSGPRRTNGVSKSARSVQTAIAAEGLRRTGARPTSVWRSILSGSTLSQPGEFGGRSRMMSVTATSPLVASENSNAYVPSDTSRHAGVRSRNCGG